MKKSLLLLIMVYFGLAASTLAQQAWQWQNPLPQGNGLFAGCLTDDQTYVAVGACGTVIRTADQGTS